MSLKTRVDRLEQAHPPPEPEPIDWEALALPIELRVARELGIETLEPVERYRAVKLHLETHQRLFADAHTDVLVVSIWRDVRRRQLGLRDNALEYWQHNAEGILEDMDPLKTREEAIRDV